VLLIGIDAASQPEKCGYAIGHLEVDRVRIARAGLLASADCTDAVSKFLVPALRSANRALVALDAPLGWPASLATSLIQHKAGERVAADKQTMFCRETDRHIRRTLGKIPLEVGADKIARAAFNALELLATLRESTARQIPLAWSPSFEGTAAIEVYPAATLSAIGVPQARYKQADAAGQAKRSAIASMVADEVPGLAGYVSAPIDVFDACLCLVAARDFVLGRAVAPQDKGLAEQEGWIWVRRQ
jgi:predicted RNase H-like nuclease